MENLCHGASAHECFNYKYLGVWITNDLSWTKNIIASINDTVLLIHSKIFMLLLFIHNWSTQY